MSSNPIPALNTLKVCSLFRGFSDSGLVMMAKIARERSIHGGTPIFVENMMAESLFIVKQGVVQLSVKNRAGQDCALEKLAPGEAFGEMSLLIGGQRLATATASTDCDLLEITRRDFASLQKQKPQACLKLMMNIIHQFGAKLAGTKPFLQQFLTSQNLG